MKSRKIFTTLFTVVSLAALLDTTPITANAANNKTAITSQAQKHYVLKDTPKLSKWGYILNVNSTAQPIFVGKDNYEKLLNNPFFKGTKTISSKKIKHIRFKVIKIMVFKNVSGSPEYLVTSKNHKYNAWTPNAGLQYYAIYSKPLQKVVTPLRRIQKRDSDRLNRKTTLKDAASDHKRIAKNKQDFALAVKAAKKLKGSQRKFVLESLKQMEQDGSISNVMLEKQNNILLWSIK
ncbi:hypothetical protein [uncultured Lactobacillus sp.]|mgnify:CR=1 FL=1|uniref:hypothetical protein n=1 Tax=uncultured Lactobacillus sp. TaxID=153152 RepID=UPI002804B949|nr:hypothetical protein [uncultured Lactobacillus sp.]